MTDEEKIIQLAKLDGWKLDQGSDGEFGLINPNGLLVGSDFDPHTTLASFIYKLPHYLTSYDAIIPLIQRQDDITISKVEMELAKLDNATSPWATSSEIADALLKAKGYKL